MSRRASKPDEPKDAPRTDNSEIRTDSETTQTSSEKTPVTTPSSMPIRKVGRYKLEKKLGAGAMGTVYLATDDLLKRQVALKVPKFKDQQNRKILTTRFYREAQAVARLTHPNICPVYDVGESDNLHFLAMGFIKGKPMDEIIGDGKTLEPRTAASIIRKIAVALQHAHDHQVVHRDLKPGNIMYGDDDEPYVMDFGLARLQDETDTAVTRDGQVIGSPAYMSPEQISGQKVDFRTDVFSLGVVFYEALTGQRPFGGNITQVLTSIVTGTFQSPSAVIEKLDPQVNQIVLKMMATKRSDRYQSMAEAAIDISKYLKSKNPGNKPKPKSIPKLYDIEAELQQFPVEEVDYVATPVEKNTLRSSSTEALKRKNKKRPSAKPSQERSLRRPALIASATLAGALILACIMHFLGGGNPEDPSMKRRKLESLNPSMQSNNETNEESRSTTNEDVVRDQHTNQFNLNEVEDEINGSDSRQ